MSIQNSGYVFVMCGIELRIYNIYNTTVFSCTYKIQLVYPILFDYTELAKNDTIKNKVILQLL